MSDKYVIQLNDSHIWWWLWNITDVWSTGELQFCFQYRFQTQYSIGAGLYYFQVLKLFMSLHDFSFLKDFIYF